MSPSLLRTLLRTPVVTKSLTRDLLRTLLRSTYFKQPSKNPSKKRAVAPKVLKSWTNIRKLEKAVAVRNSLLEKFSGKFRRCWKILHRFSPAAQSAIPAKVWAFSGKENSESFSTGVWCVPGFDAGFETALKPSKLQKEGENPEKGHF